MQYCRGNYRGGFLKYLALGEAGKRRHDHVAPVRQGLRSVIQVRAATKMIEAAASVRVLSPQRCTMKFWISERKRISSGNAVPTKISPDGGSHFSRPERMGGAAVE